MTRQLFFILALTLLSLISHTLSEIPRACSTNETKSFPFCNPSLPLDQRISDLISRIHDDEKPLLLTARMSPKGNISRIGLPEYDWGLNCIHGVQSRCGTKCPTSFPCPNALGASFDRKVWYEMASIIGLEARSLWLQGVGENHANNLPHMGLDCWSPNININRDPRWGRNQEVPSEDPYLAGQYGSMYTQGLQKGPDPRYLQAVVTLKHWDAYSLEQWSGGSRHNFNAVVDDYDLVNTYFPAFKTSVVDGGAMGVMCSYNALNGVPTCASSFLNEVLRDKWGFEGYVTSDSGAVRDIWDNHHYVSNGEDAVKVAIVDGGTDINSGSVYLDYLYDALQKKVITEDDVNAALEHTLGLRFRLGLFDPIEDQPYWHVSPDVVSSKASQAFNLLSAQESLVLLKNDKNTLPFSKGKTVAVVGPHGNATSDMIGNYRGQICMDKSTNCVVSPFLAISKVNGGKTSYNEGCGVTSTDKSGFAAAVNAAKASDYVVMILGTNDEVEHEGHDRKDITLPGVQEDFAKEILAVGKPTVVVLINGGIVAIDTLKGSAPAIIEAFFPGFQGGTALASVIFGDFNPGGKLPVTLYASDYTNQVDFADMSMTKSPGRTYRYFTGTPLFDFGYGLSYTSFSLTWGNCSKGKNYLHTAAPKAQVCYQVVVKNTGSRTGDEVVQAYFTPSNPGPLKKQLFDFDRVRALKSGDSATLEFILDIETLGVGDKNGRIMASPGFYSLTFTNGVDQVLETTLEVRGEGIVLDEYHFQ